MTDNAAYDDLIASLEMTLNCSFEGKNLEHIVATVQKRIAELTPEAQADVEFDEAGLELGMLQKMLAKLLGADIAIGAPLKLQ